VFASEHLNNNTPIHVIQALLGHASPDTVMVYAKLYPTTLVEEYRKTVRATYLLQRRPARPDAVAARPRARRGVAPRAPPPAVQDDPVSRVDQASADVDAMADELIRMPAYFQLQGIEYCDIIAAGRRYAREAHTAYTVRQRENPDRTPEEIFEVVVAAVWARGFAVGRQHHRLESLGDA
jgi:hypothetical protein